MRPVPGPPLAECYLNQTIEATGMTQRDLFYTTASMNLKLALAVLCMANFALGQIGRRYAL